MRPGYVYVASSWRNPMFDATVAILTAAGVPLYDFKNPSPNTGFAWTEVMPSFDNAAQLCDGREYLTALRHPRAVEGFRSDFEAMQRADTFVLVLPCGRSAHLELGWAVGAGKRTAILLDGPQVTPELMYKMVDYIAPSVFDLLGWLGVDDDDEAPAPAASFPVPQADAGAVEPSAAPAPRTPRARYVLDRDDDLWQSVGDGVWRCLTTESVDTAGQDLLNVCGPLRELAVTSGAA